jgi:hypothetical protein
MKLKVMTTLIINHNDLMRSSKYCSILENPFIYIQRNIKATYMPPMHSICSYICLIFSGTNAAIHMHGALNFIVNPI